MKYWQKVRVTSWFYEGLEGIVIQEITEYWIPNWNYQVKFGITDITPFDSPILKLSDLELIK